MPPPCAISATSAALTPAKSTGSRYAANHTAAQATPTRPVARNTASQPYVTSSQVSTGVRNARPTNCPDV